MAKSKSSAAKKTTASKAAATPVRRVSQQQPTTDRYKDIQQALTDRGYFKGEVDGQWGPGSIEALKQFQREQKIDEDGKLNSLTLIALGLGPHRNLTPRPSAETAQAEASAGSAPAGP